MKHSLVAFRVNFELAEERISEFEDRSIEIVQFKELKEKRMRKLNWVYV